MRNLLHLLFLLQIPFFITGCASFDPAPLNSLNFQKRIETKSDGGVSVSVSVLNADESRKLFDVPLADQGIQPVWLEITNHDKNSYWLMPVSIDTDYFSPYEVAWKNHYTFSDSINNAIDQCFYKYQIKLFIPSQTTVSGFVYTNLAKGYKKVPVTLVSDNNIKRFLFFPTADDLNADYEHVDFENLYSKDAIVEYKENGLRENLEKLPASTSNIDNSKNGDPLNLVLIGKDDDIFSSLIGSGWSESEVIYSESVWLTTKSFLFGSRYRYSPISLLYVFGRKQDVAFQKARRTINERNHLRLWLTPMRFEGKSVWLGQISRDIGVRFMWQWPFTTHKIDPDVDEARDYLIEDLVRSQGIEKIGFVKGVGEAPISKQRENLTDDPYFTDGLRLVLIFTDKPVSLLNISFLDWDFPQ